MTKLKHVYLVDGSGYIFRAYHALPPLTRPDGTPVGAVLGFTNIMLKFLRETDADHIAVVFDASRRTFRDKIYAQYKANRPDTPEDLIPQFKLVREATDAMNVARIEQEDYEADDLIAAYAKAAVKAGATVTIVSSDKDLMQLVTDKVEMFDPIKQKPIRAPEVREKFGVGPEHVIEVQALIGDSVDNVPGVKGVSDETAAPLITEYGGGSLERLLERASDADKLKADAKRNADKLEASIFKLAAGPFNIGSPKQLGDVLFDKLKLPGGKKGKTGNYGVSNDVLNELATAGHEIASVVLKWRFHTKVCSSLVDLLREQADKAKISKQLVTLNADVPLPLPIDALEVRPLDGKKLGTFLQVQGFRSILNRLDAQLRTAIGKDGPPPAPATVSATAPASTDANGAMTVAVPENLAAAKPAYEVVQDMPALERWVARAVAEGTVAVAVETATSDAMQTNLLGVALAIEPGAACYIPLDRRARNDGLDLGGATAKQIPQDRALERLKALLEDPGTLKVGHNAKFAIEVLRRRGIAMAPIDDTLLLSFVLEGGRHGHDLDELAPLHFGHEMIKLKDLVGSGKSQIELAAVPLDRARDFVAEQADYALRLRRLLRPRLLAERMVSFYETVERPLVPVVAEMERAGIMVDRARLRELSTDFAGRMVELEREIYKLAGHEFNLGSPKQLGEVLFDELKLAPGKKMKTGAYGTDASVLEELAEDHPLPQRVLDWRQLQKLKSTYADTLADEINPETGRIHTSYSLVGAVTGRLSSTDPNLQNIPIRTEEGRKIRRAFVAAPGHVLLSADYSQIELRLAAHVAGVEALKEAFKRGDDIHAMTASEVFGVPMKKMDAVTRRRAKAINFGIIYGISAFGLGRQIQVPQSEAAAYIKAYFERFPGIRDYMERMKQVCRERGYVETIFGRRCAIPGIKDSNYARRNFAERQAINAPLQGSAADIIKRAMARVPVALAKAGLKARMLLQVHDELVFEVPVRETNEVASLVKEVMEGAVGPSHTISVPLVVETGSAQNWEEAH